MLRATRADRLEGELLAGLAEGGRSIVKALRADRDARATLALFHRYRREADGEVRRSLDALVRLHRARTEGLLPDGKEAERAQAELDEALAELPAPSEPKIARIVPTQRLAGPANDDAAPARAAAAGAAPGVVAPPTPSPAPTGAALLRQYRWFRSKPERARMWRQITPAQRADVLAAAGAGDADAAAPYETLRPILAG
jgi:hypothetical protein